MDGSNQAEILEKLSQMKKELARKEKKLKKCARAASAKEHVKRRLREQEVLEGDTFQCTSEVTCGSSEVQTIAQEELCLEGKETKPVQSVSSHYNSLVTTFHALSNTVDKDVEIVSVQKTSRKFKECISLHRKNDITVAACNKQGTENQITKSDSDKSLNWNSSNEIVSSSECQGRRSLSLNRKRNVSKCMTDSLPTDGNHHSLPADSVIGHEQKLQNVDRKSVCIAQSPLQNDTEKGSNVLSDQEFPASQLKQRELAEKLQKPELNNRIESKRVKRRRRTIGRILDVELEQEINFPVDSESSQNSEEYETLRLIQESYRSGADYSTRHGKTHTLPSMLSSIFQYFIDENRRQKEPCDFNLPSDQFGKMMQRRLKETKITGALSDDNSMDVNVSGSPALFGLPRDSSQSTEDSIGSSQDSQLFRSRRVNRGESLKHLGCIQMSKQESLECVAACCVQIIRRRTDLILCISQSTISLWNQKGDNYACVDSWKLSQDYRSVECHTFPAVFRDKFCYFVVLLHGSITSIAQVVHYNAKTDEALLLQCIQGYSITACSLTVDAIAVGQNDQTRTRITKYAVTYDGQLTAQQEFDPSPDGTGTGKSLTIVENLPSTLVLWSTTNHLLIWNTETGTLVWTFDLSKTWSEISTLVSIQWQQDYLLLCLLADQKSDNAGVLLVINPEKEISKVLLHYTATSWEGVKSIGQLEGSVSATDHRGQTCVWEPYSGQLSYHADPSTGIKGLGHYWRKLITIYNQCVHIFK
ncbi:uncharacterized protein [Argopecten irradians]|uniref:uncharacterized protein isoform X2 n=1 Tax=Argopecten irradians TaxID=31199 RepID=UPI0037228D0D